MPHQNASFILFSHVKSEWAKTSPYFYIFLFFGSFKSSQNRLLNQPHTNGFEKMDLSCFLFALTSSLILVNTSHMLPLLKKKEPAIHDFLNVLSNTVTNCLLIPNMKKVGIQKLAIELYKWILSRENFMNFRTMSKRKLFVAINSKMDLRVISDNLDKKYDCK